MTVSNSLNTPQFKKVIRDSFNDDIKDEKLLLLGFRVSNKFNGLYRVHLSHLNFNRSDEGVVVRVYESFEIKKGDVKDLDTQGRS